MKISNIKLGLILSYVSLVTHAVISIIYAPILIRFLGKNEYGLYNLSTSITGYLSVLSFGFVNTYLRYYSKYKVENDNKKIADLNGLYLIVFSCIGFLSLLAGAIIVLNISNIFQESLTPEELGKAKILISIIVVNVSVSFPLGIFQFFLTAQERFVFIRLISLAETIIYPCLVVCALHLGFRSVSMTVIALGMAVVAKTIQIIYCFSRCGYSISLKSVDLGMFRSIFVFSSYIFLNIVAEQLNLEVDKFVLGKYRGTADVAVYGIAAHLNAIYLSIANNIATVVKPRVNRLVLSENSNGTNALFIKIGRLQIIVLSLIVMGFAFIGRQFVLLWVGNDFVDSYSIALLLMLPFTLSHIQLLSAEVQRAKNLHKFRSILYFVVAIMNLSISIPLGRRYGGIGCATGTAISVILGHIIIMGVYNQRVVGLSITGLLKNALSFVPALIAPAIAGITLNRFLIIDSISRFIFSGAVIVLVFSVSMWLIGLNEYEKGLVLSPLKKLRR